LHGDRLAWQQQLQQSGLAGHQAGKALINSKSDDHENVNIFYEKKLARPSIKFRYAEIS
jgi:hypothetical protein